MNEMPRKMESRHAATGPEAEIGRFRRFGPDGEVYEVMGVAGVSDKGERMMRIALVKTGEQVDYRLSRLLVDPLEA